ncbi:MAG: type II toxin-antitoxin system RelE/ParE family toxin [Clostridia bacterium]|nr:type II toxin-antitoxin system RelE/ParE family toxin [Clostridia bacterium]
MMEKYDVQYAPLAIEDLRNIYRYIAHSLLEPTTALKQTDRIREGIRSLSAMPSRHPLVDWEPWRSLQIRKLPIDNYMVFYSVNPEVHSVTVYRIFYGGRNIQEIAQI